MFVAVAKASLTFAMVVLIVGCSGSTPGSPQTPASQTSPGAPAVASTPASVAASDLRQGHWSTLPLSPIRGRSRQSVVWTGHQLLVWGGFSYLTKMMFADGAAYDPVTNHWHKIHDGPLSPRVGQVAIWTGREMVVWGGFSAADTVVRRSLGDGAAYNPTTDSWRKLPSSPLASRGGAFGVWTGTETIVIGGVSGSGKTFVDGAAFDPQTQHWRVIPPPSPVGGHPITWETAVSVDGQLLAWSRWSTVSQPGTRGGVDLFAYSSDTAAWRPIPPSPAAPAVVRQAVVANSVVIVRGLPFACSGLCPFVPEVMASYDPATMVWSRLPPIPWDGASLTLWTGAALFAFDDSFVGREASPGDAIAYDPTNHEWLRLPATPLVCSITDASVWTGREVVLFCQDDDLGSGPPYVSGLAFAVS